MEVYQSKVNPEAVPLTDALRRDLFWEYLVQNAGLDESQAGIKIAGREINNFRHADA